MPPQSYKGLAAKYGPEFVCTLKDEFKRYIDVHNFIEKNRMIGVAPYRCRVKSNHQHFHLTSNKRDVETYKKWKEIKELKRSRSIKRMAANKSLERDAKYLDDILELGPLVTYYINPDID